MNYRNVLIKQAFILTGPSAEIWSLWDYLWGQVSQPKVQTGIINCKQLT